MTFSRPDFPVSAMDAAKAHALTCYPEESCGLIIHGEYVPCVNMAAEPENDFKIAPENVIAAGDGLEAVIHSHPNGLRRPSAADMQAQIDMSCIFGIIPCNAHETFEPLFWGDFRLDEPLVGREFIHGVNDCGSLIRAYFWQTHAIMIPDFARDDAWWKNGQDLYQTSFARAGFTRIDKTEAREGDVFLGMVRSSVPNHGGILLDHGLGIHHLENRLSRREPIGKWDKFITHWLRYTGN